MFLIFKFPSGSWLPRVKNNILFCLRRVRNKGTLMVLYSSATPLTPRCLHWNPVWASDILMISLWVAQRKQRLPISEKLSGQVQQLGFRWSWKCELITHRDFQVNDTVLQSFKKVELEDATLLGAICWCGPWLGVGEPLRRPY